MVRIILCLLLLSTPVFVFSFQNKIKASSSIKRHHFYLSKYNSKLNAIEGFNIDIESIKNTIQSKLSNIHFPALENEFNQVSNYVINLANEWNLFDKVYSGPEWLGWFDVARLPLDPKYHDILSNLPVWSRLAIGLTSLEIVPLLLDLLILNAVYTRLTKLPEQSEIEKLPKSYDKNLISLFYSKYPGLVIQRTLEILNDARPFLFGIIQYI